MIRSIKARFTVLALLGLLAFAACTKDLGNYSYHMPDEPVVSQLDTVYHVLVGDSLRIDPVISNPKQARLMLIWNISSSGDTAVKDITDTADRLHIIFGFGARRYSAKLVVYNLDNGMKYFHSFFISGETAFTYGISVLSNEGGQTQLSFIKPDWSIQARVYNAVNPGEQLPANPTQILAIPQAYQPPIKSYWVFGRSGYDPGVQIDANTMRKIKTIKDNYFDAPDTTLTLGKMFVTPLGVISGVINDKLVDGSTNTWDQAPVYGMFGLGATGDYALSPEIGLDYTGIYGPGAYIGFDKNRKQFIRINLYGGAVYFGPAYSVVQGTAFNPMSLGMDLVHLERYNGGLCYAWTRSSDNTLYELKFNADFNATMQFNPMAMRTFSRPDLILPATQWASTPNEVIYFSSGSQVYIYNPVNLDLKPVTADLGGKTVTMIKVIDGGNTLVAGVDGSLYFMDISTGKTGNLIRRVDGVPGTPVDIAVRQQ